MILNKAMRNEGIEQKVYMIVSGAEYLCVVKGKGSHHRTIKRLLYLWASVVFSHPRQKQKNMRHEHFPPVRLDFLKSYFITVKSGKKGDPYVRCFFINMNMLSPRLVTSQPRCSRRECDCKREHKTANCSDSWFKGGGYFSAELLV
jgi:hypothetical protein